jgi:hypothetical protein
MRLNKLNQNNIKNFLIFSYLSILFICAYYKRHHYLTQEAYYYYTQTFPFFDCEVHLI